MKRYSTPPSGSPAYGMLCSGVPLTFTAWSEYFASRLSTTTYAPYIPVSNFNTLRGGLRHTGAPRVRTLSVTRQEIEPYPWTRSHPIPLLHPSISPNAQRNAIVSHSCPVRARGISRREEDSLLNATRPTPTPPGSREDRSQRALLWRLTVTCRSTSHRGATAVPPVHTLPGYSRRLRTALPPHARRSLFEARVSTSSSLGSPIPTPTSRRGKPVLKSLERGIFASARTSSSRASFRLP